MNAKRFENYLDRRITERMAKRTLYFRKETFFNKFILGLKGIVNAFINRLKGG